MHAAKVDITVNHPRSGVLCNLVVCVCLSDDNFTKPWSNKFIFAHPLYFQASLYMKVIGSRSRSKKSRKSPFLQ